MCRSQKKLKHIEDMRSIRIREENALKKRDCANDEKKNLFFEITCHINYNIYFTPRKKVIKLKLTK